MYESENDQRGKISIAISGTHVGVNTCLVGLKAPSSRRKSYLVVATQVMDFRKESATTALLDQHPLVHYASLY